MNKEWVIKLNTSNEMWKRAWCCFPPLSFVISPWKKWKLGQKYLWSHWLQVINEMICSGVRVLSCRQQCLVGTWTGKAGTAAPTGSFGRWGNWGSHLVVPMKELCIPTSNWKLAKAHDLEYMEGAPSTLMLCLMYSTPLRSEIFEKTDYINPERGWAFFPFLFSLSSVFFPLSSPYFLFFSLLFFFFYFLSSPFLFTFFGFHFFSFGLKVERWICNKILSIQNIQHVQILRGSREHVKPRKPMEEQYNW